MTERTGDRPELIEKVIKISRVAKVVKGGRRFSFSALVIVGNGQGRVGFSLGKANEVTEAIRKGIEKATKSMKHVVSEGRTIPHPVIGRFGSSRVIMKPAEAGRGIIASGPVRAVMEAAGIADVSAKTRCSSSSRSKRSPSAAGCRWSACGRSRPRPPASSARIRRSRP